jgi:hypothetical protein
MSSTNPYKNQLHYTKTWHSMYFVNFRHLMNFKHVRKFSKLSILMFRSSYYFLLQFFCQVNEIIAVSGHTHN